MIHQAKSNRPLLDEQTFSERLASAISVFGTSRHFAAPRILVAIGVPAQPVDATQALNLSAGVFAQPPQRFGSRV
jgi:hypothetical protein